MFVPKIDFVNIEALRTYFKDNKHITIAETETSVLVNDYNTDFSASWSKRANGTLEFVCYDPIYWA
jgi:hypothetical protein|nr:MAG TPA: hypothetical protein [Bacteriophage sp.]